MTRQICFAEWDLDFTNLTQRSHFCAASIIALYSNFVNIDGNIQNLYDKTQIQQLLEQAGFTIEKQFTIDVTYLQDAKWEKNYANSIRSELANAPEMLQILIKSYYNLMNSSDGN